MEIKGQCHCGALRYKLLWPIQSSKIPARACQCSYCLRFGGNWTSQPDARLEFTALEPTALGRYRFGSQTADFLFCRHCGVKMIAVCTIDKRDYAVVNINNIISPAQLEFEQSTTNFDGESTAQRLERRAQRWISQVRFIPARSAAGD